MTLVNFRKYRKLVVTGLGLAVTLILSFITEFADVLPPAVYAVAVSIAGVLTLIGVYAAKNEKTIEELEDLLAARKAAQTG